MKTCWRGLLSAMALGLFLVSCNGESDLSSGDGSTGTMLSGTINGEAVQIVITSETTVQEPDRGVLLTMTGTYNGDDVTFRIDISGGVEISIPEGGDQELQVGGADINVRLTVGAVNYLATSGTVSLTAYDVAVNGTIAGRFDVGLVSFGSESPGQPAMLDGAFDVVVVDPTTSSEEN